MSVGTLKDTITKPIENAESKLNIVTKTKTKERKLGAWLVSFTPGLNHRPSLRFHEPGSIQPGSAHSPPSSKSAHFRTIYCRKHKFCAIHMTRRAFASQVNPGLEEGYPARRVGPGCMCFSYKRFQKVD